MRTTTVKAAPASPGHLDIVTPITHLPQRWQNRYRERLEENLIHHGLDAIAAATEARVHVAREIYFESSRKAEAKLQIPMFGDGQLPKVRRR